MQINLAYKNCVRRPKRSILLMLMSMILCFSILAGTLVNMGLNNGLKSLETRLGADIMIIPDSAVAKKSFDNIILQGVPGYFYMDKNIVSQVKQIEGVKDVTFQIYLATLGASCCSVKVQLIGIDTESDYVVKPWIYEGNNEDLKEMEVLVGNQVNAFPGEKLTFYGVDVRVVGRLDETGTYMDSSIYADNETIKNLISAAEKNKTFKFDYLNPDTLVSCILINTEENISKEEVLIDISNKIQGVKAVKTQSIIADISEKISSMATLTKFMIMSVWALLLIIMFMGFSMIIKERQKELAVLRIVGATRSKIFFVIFNESLLISIVGSVIGAILAVIVSSMGSSVIEKSLNFPFLLPGYGKLALLIISTILVSIATASIAAGIRAYIVTRSDIGLIIKGDR